MPASSNFLKQAHAVRVCGGLDLEAHSDSIIINDHKEERALEQLAAG